MGLDMRLELKLGQQLVMTPQLQQAIKLLQLSRMDLIDAVREELMENPMLEESSEIDAHAARLDTVQEMRDQDQKDRTPDVEVDGSQLSEQAANQIDWENPVRCDVDQAQPNTVPTPHRTNRFDNCTGIVSEPALMGKIVHVFEVRGQRTLFGQAPIVDHDDQVVIHVRRCVLLNDQRTIKTPRHLFPRPVV